MRHDMRALRRLFWLVAFMHAVAAFGMATAARDAANVLFVLPLAVGWVWVAARLPTMLVGWPGVVLAVCALSIVLQLLAALALVVQGSSRAVAPGLFLALFLYMAIRARSISRDLRAELHTDAAVRTAFD